MQIIKDWDPVSPVDATGMKGHYHLYTKHLRSNHVDDHHTDVIVHVNRDTENGYVIQIRREVIDSSGAVVLKQKEFCAKHLPRPDLSYDIRYKTVRKAVEEAIRIAWENNDPPWLVLDLFDLILDAVVDPILTDSFFRLR